MARRRPAFSYRMNKLATRLAFSKGTIRRHFKKPFAVGFSAAAAAGVTAAILSINNQSFNAENSSSDDLDVEELLVLMKDIDQNMQVLYKRLLDNLQDSKPMSKSQRAIEMSMEFESLLEKVQDSVFRNHRVSKTRVSDLLQAVANASVPVTESQAETFQILNDRLGRMRWETTGSRVALVGGAKSPLFIDMDETDILPLDALLTYVSEIFDGVNAGLEASSRATNEQLAAAYMDLYGKVTEETCEKYKIGLVQLEKNLQLYGENPVFTSTLEKLVMDQQERMAKLFGNDARK